LTLIFPLFSRSNPLPFENNFAQSLLGSFNAFFAAAIASARDGVGFCGNDHRNLLKQS
jgi:hypothetical protein